MAVKVVMAQLSPTMEEGTLVEWKMAEGDTVAQGDVVAEIETDKANMDVEALGGGVLRKILVEAGTTAPVGALIGIIADPDEQIDDLIAAASASAAAHGGRETAQQDKDKATAQPTTVTQTPEPVAQPEPETSASIRSGGRIKASPLARRMAREAGIELASIGGSGPGGRIVKADVRAAVLRAQAGAGAPARLEARVEVASQMRKTIARRLSESIGPVPHFFLTVEVDMGFALQIRAALNDLDSNVKVGVNDLILKTAAEALARHPEVNASWEGDALRYHGSADLGIAVALQGGLITPILRQAERKDLRQIAIESRGLVSRARNRQLAPEEFQGGTFTISNLGMFGIDEFTAIINPPQAAILAVGQTVEKAVVVDGQVAVRKRMRVTMSCDHRVIDGATGAQFLATFKALLENPLEMLL